MTTCTPRTWDMNAEKGGDFILLLCSSPRSKLLAAMS